MSVSRRLAEILEDYTAILNDIERRHSPVVSPARPPVLLEADRQRGCTAPTIKHADESTGRHRDGWLQ